MASKKYPLHLYQEALVLFKKGESYKKIATQLGFESITPIRYFINKEKFTKYVDTWRKKNKNKYRKIQRIYARKYSLANPGKIKKYARKSYEKKRTTNLPDWLDRNRKLQKKYYYNPKNSLKIKARSKTITLIRSGKLQREPCVICGLAKSEGHHPDYNKSNIVIWLCKAHHEEVHRKPR